MPVEIRILIKQHDKQHGSFPIIIECDAKETHPLFEHERTAMSTLIEAVKACAGKFPFSGHSSIIVQEE